MICRNIIGQEKHDIKFNHLSYTIEYQDLKAFRESSFVNDTLVVLETRITKVDSVTTRTVNFLYGQSNYLELFQTSSDDPNLGFLTIVLSIDKINGHLELKDYLDKSYVTGLRHFERNIDGNNVPWYESLAVVDTSIVNSEFMTKAHFWFWIMGYKTEYFEYNGYKIENDELTCENYLEKYASERKDKIIKRFSGIVMNLNPDEKKLITEFFENIGYDKINENEYISQDNFKFQIIVRKSGDQNSLKSIEFETSKEFARIIEVKISDHITISIQGNKGEIFFK